MRVGSLFSGIGGFDLGLERAGCEIKWQVEIDPYCRKVLSKHWPAVPCHADITTINWRDIPAVDLWPEVVRCLEVIKPTWFLGENVPGLIDLGLDQVLVDLENLSYETATFSIPACAVDAPHVRQRLWIVAYQSCTHDGASLAESVSRSIQQSRNGPLASNVAHIKNSVRGGGR